MLSVVENGLDPQAAIPGIVGIQQSPGKLCANQRTEPRNRDPHTTGLALPPWPQHQHIPAL
uniref:Pleckstrin homology and RUN domain containing M1 n=1 Tax=Homo sapiens TaxID=9606 RepID=A0A8V8TQZ6_HUMAN